MCHSLDAPMPLALEHLESGGCGPKGQHVWPCVRAVIARCIEVGVLATGDTVIGVHYAIPVVATARFCYT